MAAVAPEHMDWVLEELICSICRDYFTDPVITRCGHNFCQDCITQCWERGEPAACPLCRTPCSRTELIPNVQLGTAAQKAQHLPPAAPHSAGTDSGVCATLGDAPKPFGQGAHTPICAVCKAAQVHKDPAIIHLEDAAEDQKAGTLLWPLPMDFSTLSGWDMSYKQIVQEHFEAGMRELVCFTQHLLKAEADPDAYGKICERIAAASQEMSAAEEELGTQLKEVNARMEELVVKKKSLQDEQDKKQETLTQLKLELESCCRLEREAREMLEKANKEHSDMKAEVSRREAEAHKNRVIRDVGIGLMFLPFVGTIAGSIMVGCGQVAMDAANAAAAEAQKAVDQQTAEVSRHSEEVHRYNKQEQQTEAEITEKEQRLAQIDEEKLALAKLQEEMVALQSGLRKCTTFVNGLAGRVWAVKRLTKDLLIYKEIAGILGEVVQQVLPLMSPGGEAGTRFLALGELRDLTEKLKSGIQGLRALANAESAAIDY